MPKSDISKDGDYRVVAVKSLGSISKVNKGIRARNRCDDKVIAKYATAGNGR